MIIWINGAFGSGKTTCAYELNRRLPDSFVYDPENIGYFIRENIPKKLHELDFQNHEQWWGFNYHWNGVNHGQNDKRSRFKKLIDRSLTLMKHIR